MIHHTERPVKLYNTLIRDDTPRPKKQERPQKTPQQQDAEAAYQWEVRERVRLECLSTVQLRHVCKKEHINVPRYRRGARKVYISAILHRHAKEQGIRLN